MIAFYLVFGLRWGCTLEDYWSKSLTIINNIVLLHVDLVAPSAQSPKPFYPNTVATARVGFQQSLENLAFVCK